MKTGKTLQELARQLDEIKRAREDFIVDTRAIKVQETGAGNALVASIMDTKDFVIRPHALRQIESHLQVPAPFADRLQNKHPDLLAGMLTELFNREPCKQMVRTLNTDMRAFLSDAYRIIDNFDIAEVVLPVLIDHGAHVISCDVTEHKMYIKAVIPSLKATFGPPPGAVMGKGHTFFVEEVQGGITIGNSETGQGRFSAQASIFTQRCTNFASFKDSNYGKVHLGRKQGKDSEEAFWKIMSDETKRKTDEALFSQVRDYTVAAMDGRLFNDIVERLRAARGEDIKGNPVACVEKLADYLQLTETEKGGVLNHLIAGGELTKYGLHAAVTRTAEDLDDYDRATQFEGFGSQVIDLPASEWQRLAEAA